MTQFFNPDTPAEIALVAFLALCSLLAVVTPVAIPAWLALRKQGRRIGEIRDHVSNDHDTNLRDDMDEIRDLLRGGLHEIRRDIGGLREELRTERVERIEGDRRALLQLVTDRR